MEGVDSANIIPSFYGFDIERVVGILEDDFNICSAPATGASMDGTCLAQQDTDRQIREKTLGFFGQSTFKIAVGEGDATLVTGLRYEVTDVDLRALVLIPTGTRWGGGNEFYLTYSPERDFTQLKGSYDFWLPSVDFSIEPVRDVMLRASYSHTITRPTYNNLQGGRTYDPLFYAFGGRGNQGNPGLLPYKSENFDVSAEWYYGPSSYISAGYFRKNVKNYIGSGGIRTTIDGIYDPSRGPRADAARAALGQDASSQEIFAYIAANYPDTVVNGEVQGVAGDQLVQFDVTLPSNSDQTATIQGWEFAIQHDFWDTGFGTILNYTIVNGDGEFDNTQPFRIDQFALLGLSDSANAVLYYDKGPFQARVAWNWRDKYLAGYSSNPTNPFYRDEYWQIDASASYEFDMGLTVFAEAINLTGENLKGYRRSENNTFFAYRGAPRYAAGVRFSF